MLYQTNPWLLFSPKASHGYGGKFGVEKDRVDKVIVYLLMECIMFTWLNAKESIQHLGKMNYKVFYYMRAVVYCIAAICNSCNCTLWLAVCALKNKSYLFDYQMIKLLIGYW